MREQTATAALLAAVMTTAAIAAAGVFAAAGVVVTTGVVAAAGGFATAAAAVAAAEHNAEQIGGIGLRRDTQQAHRQDGGNQTTFHGRLLKRLNTGGRNGNNGHTCRRNRRPRDALGKMRQAVTGTFSDLFSVHVLNLGVLSSTRILQLDLSAGSLAISSNCLAG
jgi:hypothetical protein